MQYAEKTCKQFVADLSSSSPLPGSGSASALIGSLGLALSMMVGNLTLGKPGYADVEPDIVKLLESAQNIMGEMLNLIEKDAAALIPLSSAYNTPKDNPARVQLMEDALRQACSVPLDVMRLSSRAIELCEEFSKKGNRGALTDAGISAVYCKAALQGAALNVFIKTKYMDNRAYANKTDKEARNLLSRFCPLADEIYNSVSSKLY